MINKLKQLLNAEKENLHNQLNKCESDCLWCVLDSKLAEVNQVLCWIMELENGDKNGLH